MLKRLELRNPQSCLSKADPDELVFVLRAKDPIAPQTLRLWAAMAHGIHSAEKIAEALSCADEMEKWRMTQYPEPSQTGQPHPLQNLVNSYRS